MVIKKFTIQKGEYYTVDLDIPFLNCLPIKHNKKNNGMILIKDVEVIVKYD